MQIKCKTILRSAEQFNYSLFYFIVSFCSVLFKGDKPHACELCNKRFALACNLRAHMKTHEDEAQEQCVRCGKDFLSASAEIKDGICRKCEDEPISVDDQEEEIEEPITIRHKKFSNKIMNIQTLTAH